MGLAVVLGWAFAGLFSTSAMASSILDTNHAKDFPNDAAVHMRSTRRWKVRFSTMSISGGTPASWSALHLISIILRDAFFTYFSRIYTP